MPIGSKEIVKVPESQSMTFKQHYYPDVPGLGNVVFTRHAQERLLNDGLTEDNVRDVLLNSPSIPDGRDIVLREGKGLRLVIVINPTPNRGAKVVKTGFKIQPQASTRNR